MQIQPPDPINASTIGTMDNDDKKIGLAYPIGQLSKSLEVSPKAGFKLFTKKAVQWQNVIEGMLSGNLDVGSRTPISNVPIWATPEVVTGGFVTGNLLAGGEATEYEQTLAQELGCQQNNPRAFLNAYHLSDEGLSKLTHILQSKEYSISVPEEGALLVIAWLIHHGHYKESAKLISEIALHFNNLRFFPEQKEKLEKVYNKVFLQPIEKTVESLSDIHPNSNVVLQKNTVKIWIPFYDNLIAHLLRLFPDQIIEASNFTLPDTQWKSTASDLVNKLTTLKGKYRVSRRFTRTGSQFSKLMEILEDLASDQREFVSLNYLCQALTRYVTKHGVPKSSEHQRRRRQQVNSVSGSLHSDIAKIVVARLKRRPQHDGLSDLKSICHDIVKQEANSSVRTGESIPLSLVKKVGRSQIDTIDSLVHQGYISSGDSIAVVLPQLTSEIRASSFEDQALQHLYGAMYQAFRRRRSLLLLNYQSQVRLKDIPWISVMDKFRKADNQSTAIAKQTLTNVSYLAIKNFPHAILPNKLLQELRALIDSANMECPLVDEVAADIFMGGFSPKFAHSAHLAGQLLKGSLYARYYGIDYEPLIKSSPDFTQEDAQAFSRYCSKLAGEKSKGWSVASNGLVIEQQQIVTTQNLASLFCALDLANQFGEEIIDVAKSCFKWVCYRQQITLADHHARLIMLKNTAYAWRQMVFFASLIDGASLNEFLSWMQDHFGTQNEVFISRFHYIVTGFSEAVSGKSVPKESRFLGWTVGKHPLMFES